MFLWVIGMLNLIVLLDILKTWREARAGKHSHAHLEELLGQRGFLNRLFGGRLQRVINHSWQMYPLGLLFGLGFDTASEIGLLAMTAGASAGDIPVAAVLCLPILFAAGMSVMDTTDGVLMVKAYDWAFVNPLRKIFYNVVITGLSVVVALVIGTIELLQVCNRACWTRRTVLRPDRRSRLRAARLRDRRRASRGWGISVAVWKFGRIEERYGHVHPVTRTSIRTTAVSATPTRIPTEFASVRKLTTLFIALVPPRAFSARWRRPSCSARARRSPRSSSARFLRSC